jgi:hypothetical protein
VVGDRFLRNSNLLTTASLPVELKLVTSAADILAELKLNILRILR